MREGIKPLLSRKLGPAYFIFCVALIIFFMTRLVLLSRSADVTIGEGLGAFAIGFMYDVFIASCIAFPFVLQTAFTSDVLYKGRYKWLMIAAYLVLISILLFTKLLPKEFNKALFNIVVGYVVFRFAVYLFLLNVSETARRKWRYSILIFSTFLVTFLLLFNGLSEWFFWQEFSTRYNFIAVDYLVYTNEVIGNIRESYPVGWMMLGIAVIAFLIVFISKKHIKRSVEAPAKPIRNLLQALPLILAAAAGFLIVKPSWQSFSKNQYANELAGNGIYDFAQAFMENDLDFFRFYQTLPQDEAFKIVQNALANTGAFKYPGEASLLRTVAAYKPTHKYNVVLISIESLSAEFMAAFGNKRNITPVLDSLKDKGLFFNSLYASGTRTVRGLEALTLSIPPTPGQSIIKRPVHDSLFSIGTVFRSQGYKTQFLYGGYSYFDNMKSFFKGNNYEVLDRDSIPDANVHYQNIWGVADEDLFTLALKTFDADHASGQPFFGHIMTVSNHRPYTYPEGRIDISPLIQSRDGAVKYTDYAIGKFLKEAQGKPWFDSTVFVITSDHCAGSAGSVALPVTGYHIPMIWYAPKIITPAQVNDFVAQIDIGPSIFGFLGFNYESKLFGQDVFAPHKKENHIFISTYEGLGFFRDSSLLLQSPVKKIEQFRPDFTTGKATSVPVEDSLRKKAIAFYQIASWMIKNNKYKE